MIRKTHLDFMKSTKGIELKNEMEAIFNDTKKQLNDARNKVLIEQIKEKMRLENLTFEKLINKYIITRFERIGYFNCCNKYISSIETVVFTKKTLFQKIFKTKQQKDLLSILK